MDKGKQPDSSDLSVFENALSPQTAEERLVSQIKAINWQPCVEWGSVQISIHAGQPALIKIENTIKLS